jgi:outer membrane protein
MVGSCRLVGMRRALLGAVAAVALSGGAESAKAASLSDALANTYNNNPTLQTERARLRATDETVPQALSGWRPTVQVTNQLGLATVNENVPGGGPHGLVPRSLDLTVTQQVYSGGTTVAATANAENLVQAERARLVLTEQQVFFLSVTAYLDVLRDQAVLDLSINNEQVLRRQLEASQDRFRVGEITRTDVAQSESRLSTATSDRIQAEGNLEVSRANYVRAVGEPPGRLSAPGERPALPTSKEEVVNLAALNNPAVISAQFTESAARDAVQQVQGQLLPSLSIVGDLNRSEDPANLLVKGRTIDTAQVTARLSVPLYESGSIYSRVRQAQQTVQQQRAALEDTRRQSVQSATTAWETLQSQRARVDALRSTIRAAEIALEGVQQEAAVGSRTVLDILNAEQELFTSRVNLVTAQHDELLAEFNVVQSIGRLTAIDLKLPVELYDPDKHYKLVRDKWAGFEGGR